MSVKAIKSDTKWRALFLFVVVISPGYLNDFFFIATNSVVEWLVEPTQPCSFHSL
jgi:hypothetical protein